MDKINNIVNDSNIEQNIPAIPAMHILRCNRQIVRDWSQAVPVRPHWRIYWNPEPGAVVSDNFQKYQLDSHHWLIHHPNTLISMKYIVEAGEFDILVGNSSRDQDLKKKTITIDKTIELNY